jgi:hypothetical protein
MFGRRFKVRYTEAFQSLLSERALEITHLASNIDAGNNFINRIESAVKKRSFHPTGYQPHLSSDGNAYFHIVVNQKWVIYYRIIDGVMLVMDVSYYGV